MATTTASTLAAVRRRGINKARASQSAQTAEAPRTHSDEDLARQAAEPRREAQMSREEAVAAGAVEAPGGTTPYKGSAQEKAAQEQQTGPSPEPGSTPTSDTTKPQGSAKTVAEANDARAAARREGGGLLGGIFGRPGAGTTTDPNAPEVPAGPDRPDAAPPGSSPQGNPIDSPTLLGNTVDLAGQVASTGQRDVERGQAAADTNQEAAVVESDEMKLGQEAGIDKLDDANVDIVQGDLDNQKLIEATRTDLEGLPPAVQAAFDLNKGDMDTAIDAGRAGIETREADALGRTMEGRAGAMDAAVASIHGALRNQMSAIDAQVQQGTLSPSQATAMKAKIRMGGSMQLSAAIGQTTLAFNKLEADVATSFGNMFTTFETNVTNAEGQFGATAAGAVGQANIAKGELNNALTDMSAQSRASRDAAISNNLATRSTFVNNNDSHNMAMLDHTDKETILAQPAAINSYTAMADTAAAMNKDENQQAALEFMMQNYEDTKANDKFNFWFTAVTQFGGKALGLLGL